MLGDPPARTKLSPPSAPNDGPERALPMADDAAWLRDFLVRWPPAAGVPPRPSLPPPPPRLRLAPLPRPSGEPQVDLIERGPARSRPQREGWQGRFQSLKVGQTVRWRSRLVFELLQHLEADPWVTHFAFRAVSLRMMSGRKRRTYTPDLMVVSRGETWFIEVAWSAQVSVARFAQLRCFGEGLAADGIGFLLLTEDQIRHQPRYGNVVRILRALPASDPPPGRRARCLDILAEACLPLADLCAVQPELTLKDVMRLTLRGDLTFDLDQPFCAATFIRHRLGGAA